MANTASLDIERSSSQYASRADASLTGLDITSTFTIECWVKLESAPSAGQYYGIVSKTVDLSTTGATNTNAQYAVWYDNDSANRLSLFVRASNTNRQLSINQTLNTGQWYHLAFVFQSATAMRIYVDGTEIGNTTSSVPTTLVNTTREFIVGSLGTTSSFDGLIDEVRVWNTARSQTEISANMSVELVGNESGLVAYYQFENVYTDLTSNGNTLTAVNSPVFSTDVPFTGLSFLSQAVFFE